MLEAEPVDGSFEEWFARIWPEYAKICRQVAQHRYVLRMAHKQWHETHYPVFTDNIERQRLEFLCCQVGLDPRECIASALKRHRAKCLNVDA